MGKVVILGELVTKSAAARALVNEELVMTGARLNRIKSHVNGF